MWSSVRNRLPTIIGIVMFTLALLVLHRSVAAVSLGEITAEFRSISIGHLFVALILTIASYLLLTLYDLIGLRYVGSDLSWRLAAPISFSAYAIGHNVGLVALSGGAIRFRAYSAAGLTAQQITRLIASCTVTFTVGALFLLGLALLLEPASVLRSIHMPLWIGYVAGALLVLCTLIYLMWGGIWHKPLQLRAWRIDPPGLRLTGSQFLLSIVDLTLSAAVMYWFLSADAAIGFPAFVGLFVIATSLGVVSSVPGGLGVIEGMMLLMLPHIPVPTLLGALLAWRVVYYLLPLVVALGIFASELLHERDRDLRAVARQGSLVLSRAAPQILAVAVFLAGAILLVSGNTPDEAARLQWLSEFVPDSLVQVSHLLGSAIGLALLLLARGLHRRLQGAYIMVLWLLGAGILVSLLKGFDYEEAVVLALATGLLWAGRDRFHRRASLLDERFTPSWLLSIGMVVTGVIWLGFFAYRHVDYSQDLWWDFAADSGTPKMLRASLLVVIMLIAFGLMRLMRTSREPIVSRDDDTLARIAAIVSQGASSTANVALTGDKDFLFHPAGDAFIMYRTSGRSAIAMGDPIGNPAHLAEVVWQFRELCDRRDLRCVFYEVASEYLSLYIDLGLTFSKLGEEARVNLEQFNLEGKKNAEFRQIRSRAGRDGASFSIIPASEVAPLLPQLRDVSDNWLANKHVREKGFSIGQFDDAYLQYFDIAVVSVADKIVAFANLWPAGDHSELSIDLMRYHEAAPKGVMDYLFVELMLWGKENKYRIFNLGMAPLSGLEHHPLATLWNRIGTLVFRFGDEFYNFDGLRRYKQKFYPEWEPRYLAAPGGLALPRVLIDATTLVAGGVKGVFAR